MDDDVPTQCCELWVFALLVIYSRDLSVLRTVGIAFLLFSECD